MDQPRYQCPLCKFQSESKELMDHIAEQHPNADSPLPIYPVQQRRKCPISCEFWIALGWAVVGVLVVIGSVYRVLMVHK